MIYHANALYLATISNINVDGKVRINQSHFVSESLSAARITTSDTPLEAYISDTLNHVVDMSADSSQTGGMFATSVPNSNLQFLL